jgi:RHS repeat-associated protein
MRNGSRASTCDSNPDGGNTFNADNEMTAFNGTPLAYDANGNLTSDGANSYAWDARDHLSAISGANTASFVYDPFGRRMSKAIGGIATQFLYDGLNPVQELQSGSPSANLLTGLGIDEYFQHTDSAGARDLLTDMLGSTLALTDATGTIQTSYTYEPFGNAAVSGAPNANPFQFTGRENDGTGLYYYRARYYSPSFQRFIGQDPLGFAGGDTNLYGYVRESPPNAIDATGLCGDHPCFGWARVLQGNSRNIGSNGAFGTPVQRNTGAIAPEQFGYPNGPAMQSAGIDPGQITGAAGPYNFTVGDVIGGRSPIPGMNVRAALRALNPGLFILELPGLSHDPGILPLLLWLPDGVPCPEGTFPGAFE